LVSASEERNLLEASIQKGNNWLAHFSFAMRLATLGACEEGNIAFYPFFLFRRSIGDSCVGLSLGKLTMLNFKHLFYDYICRVF